MSISLTLPGVKFHDDTEQTTAQYPVFKNKIINSEMMISQRGTSFPAIASGAYSLDRWVYTNTSAAVATITQQLDAPAMFINSLRYAVTTADAAIAATDYAVIEQRIEGLEIGDLISSTFTISFWVRSSKTGIHCVAVQNQILDASYIREYTINTANTWEYKTITVTGGLPNSYIWNLDNTTGLRLRFVLAAGTNFHNGNNAWTTSFNKLATVNQVNCLDTIGNIFAITGVQLERAPTATAFEYRDTNIVLMMCQRYFALAAANNRMWASAAAQTFVQPLLWPVVMRDVPTVTFIVAATDAGFTAKSAVNITQYGAGLQLTATAAGNGCYSLYGEAAALAEL